jgi:murein DD-endopeptidase MepM/ murein hydrolase activator NlpD
MKTAFLFAALVLGAPASLAAESAASPFPVQLEASVPFEPTAFTSDGRQRLVYELLLRNYESRALELQRLRVLDGDAARARPLAAFDATALQKMMQPIGVRSQDPAAATTLPPGGSTIVFLLLTLDAGVEVPRHLRQEVQTSAGSIIAEPIGTRHDALQALGPPLTGRTWLAETGLSNDNGHRRGYVLLQGRPVTSRRYAFDWVKVEDGVPFKGDRQVNTSYFGYGSPVIAVADAVVAGTTDGVPQNVPGREPAVPMTFANVPGNSVTLDIGHGHYAHYMHLQPGSLRVMVGDRVRRGQVLGLLGNAGSSFLPHLHFEVTNSPVLLSGDGVPYLLKSFTVLDGAGATAVRHRMEMPLEKMMVDFGE